MSKKNANLKVRDDDGNMVEIEDATAEVSKLQAALSQAEERIAAQDDALKSLQKAHAAQAAEAFVSEMQANAIQASGAPIPAEHVERVKKTISGELAGRDAAEAMRTLCLEAASARGSSERKVVSGTAVETQGASSSGWSQADREFTAEQLRSAGKQNVEVRTDGVYVEGRKVTG